MLAAALLLATSAHLAVAAIDTTSTSTSKRTVLLAILLPFGSIVLFSIAAGLYFYLRARRTRHGTAFTYATPGQPSTSEDGLVRSSAGVVIGHLGTPRSSIASYPHGATVLTSPSPTTETSDETPAMSQRDEAAYGAGAPAALAAERLGLGRSWTAELADARR